MKKKLLVYSLFLKIIFTTNAFAQIQNKILVKVDNAIITSYDLENKIKSLLHLANQEVNQTNINKTKNVAIQSLINLKIKQIELENFDIKENEEEIAKQINRLANGNINQFKQEFVSKNLDYNFFLNELKTELKWNTLIYLIYNKKVKVEENEIRDQLEKIIKSNSSNVELKLSEIQILSSGDEVKDQQNIKSIKDQINEFGFGITAMRNSNSSSSKQNGNLGWINMRSFSKKIYKILNKMNIGDVSSPIISSNNILFLKIMDKRVSKPDEIDKSKLKKDLENQRKNELFTLYSNSHLSKIKNKIFIKYK